MSAQESGNHDQMVKSGARMLTHHGQRNRHESAPVTTLRAQIIILCRGPKHAPNEIEFKQSLTVEDWSWCPPPCTWAPQLRDWGKRDMLYLPSSLICLQVSTIMAQMALRTYLRKDLPLAGGMHESRCS